MGQFFVPKSVEDKGSTTTDNKTNDIDTTTSISVNYPHNKQFTAQELKAMADFIDDKQYAEVIGLKRWLEDNKFIDHVKKLGLTARGSMASYSRVYAKHNFS